MAKRRLNLLARKDSTAWLNCVWSIMKQLYPEGAVILRQPDVHALVWKAAEAMPKGYVAGGAVQYMREYLKSDRKPRCAWQRHLEEARAIAAKATLLGE